MIKFPQKGVRYTVIWELTNFRENAVRYTRVIQKLTDSTTNSETFYAN